VLKSDVQTLKKDVNILKGDVNSLKDNVNTLKDDRGIIKGQIHRLGVLMESVQSEVRTALEVSKSVLKNEETANDHDKRITNLERDVRVIKSVVKR
jgi:chromosome segregation ATPase